MIRISAKGEKAETIAMRAYDLLSEEQGLRTTTSDIEIEAQEGIVNLNGRVRTNIMRNLAQRLATSAANGWHLRNNLISDESLCLAIATRIALDDRTADANVRCEAFLGVAYLKGFVRNPEQRAVALELASSVPGVTRVEDHLVIRR